MSGHGGDRLDARDPSAQIEMMRNMAGQVMVGPDGVFDLGGVAPGAYILEVSTNPPIQQRIEIVEGQPLSLTLEVPPQ